MLTYPAHVGRELTFPGPVKNGDTGMKAKRVQEWVTFHGFATPVDSSYGPATEQCVRAFQQSRGFTVTGVVDEGTWTALVAPLTSALAEFAPPAGPMGQTVLRTAQQHLAQAPIEIGGDNRGPWVRVYMGGNDGKEWLWCAGFVTFVMKQACLILDRAMPIAGSFSCDSLAYQAKDKNLFVKGSDVASGQIGWDALGPVPLFLVRRTSNDWTHTGLAFDGAGQTFSTIEGNTNDGGSANGYEVCGRTRSTSSKDFIQLPS